MDQPQELFKEAMSRMRGSFFSSFVFAWTITNWQAVYVTLFVSEEFLPFHGRKRFPDKLSYLGWLYSHDYWWVLWWLLCLLSAFFMPLILHRLNRRVRHHKLRITNEWNDADAAKAKAKVVPQEIHDLVVRERNEYERSANELSSQLSTARMRESGAVEREKQTQAQLDAMGGIEAKAQAFDNFVAEMPSMRGKIAAARSSLNQLPGNHGVTAQRDLALLAQKLDEMDKIQVQIHSARP